MTLNQLYYFKTVCEMRNIKAASETLHISQPAISKMMQELEEELQLSLLNRTAKGTTPTPNGERFLKEVQELLFRFERLQSLAKDLAEESTTLRLGVSPMVASCIFPDIYSRFHHLYPATEIRVSAEEGLYSLFEMLRRDELDVLFVPSLEAPSEFAKRTITRERLLLCVPCPADPRFHDGMTPDLFASQPLAVLPEGYLQHHLITELYSRCGAAPNIRIRTNQLSVIQSFVRSCECAAFFYESYAARSFLPEELNCYDVGMPSVPISILWKKNTYLYHSTRLFLDFMGNYT